MARLLCKQDDKITCYLEKIVYLRYSNKSRVIMMTRTVFILLISSLCTLSYCTPRTEPAQTEVLTPVDSISKDSAVIMETLPPHIEIEKELLYDKHTLEDTYLYKDTTREFQWEKMKERLSLLESIQREPSQWAILQNYKNRNGEAPLVKVFKRDAYKRVSDTLGVERYQSVPLYLLTDTVIPEIYGRDGSLVRIKAMDEDSKFARIQTVYDGEEEWYAPKKYIKQIGDTVVFDKAIFVDRHNQNIATLEHVGSKWLVRSMNPATTGQHRPPYAQETPLGMYVLQEKKVSHDLFGRRFQGDWRIRSLCQPFYEWGVYPWRTGQRSS